MFKLLNTGPDLQRCTAGSNPPLGVLLRAILKEVFFKCSFCFQQETFVPLMRKGCNTCLLSCQPSHCVTLAALAVVNHGVQIALLTRPHLLPATTNFSRISTASETQQKSLLRCFPWCSAGVEHGRK